MASEQIPQPEKEKEVPPSQEFPEGLYGENVFEISESGELKIVSPESEDKPDKKEISKKKEIPPAVLEDAKKYAETLAWIARGSKEGEIIKKDAEKNFLKEKGY